MFERESNLSVWPAGFYVSHAPEHSATRRSSKGIANLRYQFAAQTKQRFAADLDQLTPTQAANLLAVIDATTSPEAFDVMSSAHARSARQITTTWNTALEALISHWTRDTNETT